MGFFTFFITIILLGIVFVYEGIWSSKIKEQEMLEKTYSSQSINIFFKNLKNVYNQYYATIHMSNYFHYNCNNNNLDNPVIKNSYYKPYFINSSSDCLTISADKNKQFRFNNILLLSNGKMCRAYINNTNNNLNIDFNSCKKLKDWYNNGIITNIDYGLLEKFMPPKTNSATELIGVFFNGVSGYRANVYTTIPFLRIQGILFKRVAKNNYQVVKYYPVDTFSVVRDKVKAADEIINNYSYYIRAYAKNIYYNTNYNPYVFRYSLASLYFSDSQTLTDKKVVFLPGITYYNLDTSLLVSLPNSYVYKNINGKTIDNTDGNPLGDGESGDYYGCLYQSSLNSPYKDDNLVNLSSEEKLYAMKNQAPNLLKQYDINEWSSNNEDILFALLRLGKDCKAENYNVGACKRYIWFNDEEEKSPMGINENTKIFNQLYFNVYKKIYDDTSFKGPNQYAAVDMKVITDENTGEKQATVELKTLNDFYKDMFHIDLDNELSQKDNPFFGKYIFYPGTTIPNDKIGLTLLVDNTSNINYGVPTIDSNTVAIYSGYSIAFAIPYVVDAYDDKTKESVIPGLYIKVYSIVTVE